jgi:hypothetical protein
MELRPKLVPSVEVVKMLPTVSNPAVLELEDDAAENIEALAVPLPRVALNADHAAVLAFKHVQKIGPEGSTRLPAIPAEQGKDRLAALVVAGDGTAPGRVPRGALVEKLSERLHVGRVEGLVTATDKLGVFVHGFPPTRCYLNCGDGTALPVACLSLANIHQLTVLTADGSPSLSDPRRRTALPSSVINGSSRSTA